MSSVTDKIKWLLLTAVLVSASLSGSQRSVSAEPDDHLAGPSQNPLLQEHFRQFYLDARSYRDTWGRLTPPSQDFFFDQQVDRLVRDFLEGVEKKLDRIEESGQRAESAREDVLLEGGQSALEEWQKALKELSDAAGDLRSELSYILSGIESQSDSDPVLEAESDNSLFEKEMEFLGLERQKAAAQIRSYFFSTETTVQLQDLNQESMMVQLDRVKKMASRLADQLRKR